MRGWQGWAGGVLRSCGAGSSLAAGRPEIPQPKSGPRALGSPGRAVGGGEGPEPPLPRARRRGSEKAEASGPPRSPIGAGIWEEKLAAGLSEALREALDPAGSLAIIDKGRLGPGSPPRSLRLPRPAPPRQASRSCPDDRPSARTGPVRTPGRPRRTPGARASPLPAPSQPSRPSAGRPRAPRIVPPKVPDPRAPPFHPLARSLYPLPGPLSPSGPPTSSPDLRGGAGQVPGSPAGRRGGERHAPAPGLAAPAAAAARARPGALGAGREPGRGECRGPPAPICNRAGRGEQGPRLLGSERAADAFQMSKE